MARTHYICVWLIIEVSSQALSLNNLSCYRITRVTIEPYDLKLRAVGLSQNQLPPVLDMSYALEPFVNFGCLVHLTSFGTSVDLHNPPIYPLIIRQLVVKLKTSWVGSSYLGVDGHTSPEQRAIWGLKGTKPDTIFNATSLTRCNQSTYLHLGSNDALGDTFCPQIDFGKFTINVKTWKCEVRIGLFPPSADLENIRKSFLQTDTINASGFTYPSIWPQNLQSRHEMPRSFPSTIPNFNILLLNREQKQYHAASIDGFHLWIQQYLQNGDMTSTGKISRMFFSFLKRNRFPLA